MGDDGVIGRWLMGGRVMGRRVMVRCVVGRRVMGMKVMARKCDGETVTGRDETSSIPLIVKEREDTNVQASLWPQKNKLCLR